MRFSFDPVTHDAARAMIEGKPAVIRDLFDEMEPEMKLRAFTIAGVEDHDILQGVRDEIAKIPAGADWDQVKQKIARDISPWFEDGPALRRAELLMRWHAFSAYSAAEARIMDAQRDVFPYRQYLSAFDGKVRDSHRALHGKILPADHPFWTDHTPPWEFNCRCQVVELTAEDAGEERRMDAARLPENRRVMEGAALTEMESGRLQTPAGNIQLGRSIQKTAELNMPYQELAARWDADTKAHFERWASMVETEDGMTLLKALQNGIRRKFVREPEA